LARAGSPGNSHEIMRQRQ